MNRSQGLIKSKPLWSSTNAGRSLLGWHIPEEIFAVFFILVILALAKDENVVRKVQSNISIQIAIGILILYCVYNKVPWSLAFIIAFISIVSFTDFLTDAKGTTERIWEGISAKFRKQEHVNQKHDPAMMRMGARVLGMMRSDRDPPKGILKKPVLDNSEKKVSFEDGVGDQLSPNVHTDDESESDTDDEDNEMCHRVSQAFGFGEDTDTEAETTDNETEEDHQKRHSDLLNFMNTEKTVANS